MWYPFPAARLAAPRALIHRIGFTQGEVMVRFISVVAVILVSAASAQAQAPATRLSLDDAVALALRENPTVRAKQHEYRATQAQEITAGLRPNPTASYSGDQLGSSSVDPQHFWALEQPIELGGNRGRRLDAARAAIRGTAPELRDVRRQTVAQVKKAFTDTLVAEATLALAGENLRTIDEVERLQRIRAEKGDISELELTRIQVQRFAFERDAVDARQAIAAARIALRAAVGPEAVAPDFTLSGELGFRDVPLDAVALRRRALDARPDLPAAEAARGRARRGGVRVPPRRREPARLPRCAAHVSRDLARAPARARRLLGRALPARGRRRRAVGDAVSRRGAVTLLPLLALFAACSRGPDDAGANAKPQAPAPAASPNVAVAVVPPTFPHRAITPETTRKPQLPQHP